MSSQPMLSAVYAAGASCITEQLSLMWADWQQCLLQALLACRRQKWHAVSD